MNIATHIRTYRGRSSVEEGRGAWGGAKLCDKFVLILHIFLVTIEKYENDKNDFLQTQRIKQLDKYSIGIKYSYLHSSTNRKLFHAFVYVL